MTENKDQYNLYTEKIKENPWARHKTLIRLLKLAAASAFAGVIAGITFLIVIGFGSQEKQTTEIPRNEVVFSMEEYPGETTAVKEKETEKSDPLKETESTQTDSTETKTTQETVFDYVSGIMEDISPSMATVTAIHQNEDPLFAVVQNKEDFPGILIADNEVEYLLLTDYAIKDVDYIEVTFADGNTVNAFLVMTDKTLDIAVVAVEHEDVPEETESRIKIAQMGNSYMLKQSELVIAMGNLHGIEAAVDFGTTISTGEVVYEADSRHGLIYTSMNGAKNNTGFLFNEEGMLIGSISRNHSTGSIVAYGISDIKIRLQNMTNRKPIGYLGIIGHEIDEELAEERRMPQGVYVSSVESHSPAFYAGIQNGDVITDISGRTISNVYNIERTMCEFEPGTEVEVTVNRRGKDGYVPIIFTIILGEH